MVTEIVAEDKPAIYLEGFLTVIYMRSLRPFGLLDDIESCHFGFKSSIIYFVPAGEFMSFL